MRSAPSVSYPVGRSRFGAWACVLTWCAGLCALIAWTALGPSPGARHGLVAMVLLATGALAWREVRRQPQGLLAWDGEAWSWSAAGGSHAVWPELVMDLQSWMLVRLHGASASRVPAAWLWLEVREDAHNWQALRHAVYFRAGRAASPETVPANP